MLNVIICGAPGSGKGTQSQKIIEQYNLQHISTGDLLRKEIADDTEIGKAAKQLISNGQLVPDDVIMGILEKRLTELEALSNMRGVIFDGFPRTVVQAEELEKLFSAHHTQTDILLDLRVAEEELIARLLNRGITSGRTDDNLETIQKRLDVYKLQTKPVTEFYKNLGKYVEIDGMGTIDEIFSRIAEAMDAVIATME